MNKYIEFKNKEHEIYNNMPYIRYAFGEEQIIKVFNEWGLKYPKHRDKVTSLFGAGDIIQKKDLPLFNQWKRENLDSLQQEKQELLKDREFVYDMFMYELGNHEWQLSYNNNEVLYACGLTRKNIENNYLFAECWETSKKDYWQWCLDNDNF